MERIDVSARSADYRRSFDFWLRRIFPDDRVLIVENSGFDAASLIENSTRSVSIDSYVESAEVCKRGKGNGEAVMLSRIAESPLLDGVDEVVKITGRLIVRNFAHVLPIEPPHFDSITCRFKRDLTEVDTRFFAVSPSALRNRFRSLEPQILEAEGVYLEHVVAGKVLAGASDGLRRRGFREPPIFDGFSGSTGARYGGSRVRLMAIARRALSPLEDGYD